MLRRLTLQNLATIEALDIEFGPGLSALTGETGAGKSVLLGGLELALGERATAEILREGAAAAIAEAEFIIENPAAIAPILRDTLEIDWDSASPLVLRREFTAAGRSRCFVNEQMAGVAQLKALGERLVDLHGQHEHQSLFHAAAHREALDAFGGHAAVLDQYRAAWDETARLRRRKRDLDEAARDFEARLDYLQFQLDEIATLDPQPGELGELEAEEKKLAHADSLRQTAAEAYEQLYEGPGDDHPSLLGVLRSVETRVEDLAEFDADFAAALERLGGVKAELQDLAYRLRDAADDLAGDPKRLEQVIERIEALRRLLRKHGPTETAFFEARDAMQTELDGMKRDDDERRAIGEKLETAEAALLGRAAALSKARQGSAVKLAKAVLPLLKRLCMEKAAFEVALDPLNEPGSEGAERVEFMLAANPGLPPAPLRKVASGGELSRVMLALKTALAGRDAVGTLVFDEIDAGVSGEAARRVGALLKILGGAHQTLVITHHAQIASLAGGHARVSKSARRGRTFTAFEWLGREERLDELARMMGGASAGAEARQLAQALMETA